jgi:clan AA aspartic protease
MGLIYATITRINGDDRSMVRRNLMDKDEVKQMNVEMPVDTGRVYMYINESAQAQLQIPVGEKRKGQLADGSIVAYHVVAPVEVRFKNRRCTTSAMVLPGNNETLLGAIPLEDMDVVIHPQRQELIVNPDHPYFAQMKLKWQSL